MLSFLSNKRAVSRWFLALFTGAISALAMPPFGLWPILFFTFSVAVWLIDVSCQNVSCQNVSSRLLRARYAAVCGWWFGFGYFVAGLWWLGSAFLVDADEFLWALPLGVIGLPMVLGLFTAFGFGLAGALWRPDSRRIIIFTVALSLSEWLRAHVLTGFPWNSWGMAFGQGDIMAQVASLGGLHWLTLLVLFIHAAPATLADRASWAQRFLMPSLAVVVLLMVAGFGWWRIPLEPSPTQPGVRLRIMQPNIEEKNRHDPEFAAKVMAHYLDLSSQTGKNGETLEDITHLIWPESAFPFLIDYAPAAMDEIVRMLPSGTILITGAVRAEAPFPGEERYRYFNAIRVYDNNGAIIDTYDKVHLVPFGEYLPLNGLLRALGIRKFVNIPGEFESARHRKALLIPNLPLVSPLICYEAIFSSEAILLRHPGSHAAHSSHGGLLLNLTNDAWFGLTPGPYQHFAQARLRAIEQGLPLVRAANSGISAVLDIYGRIVAFSPKLGESGILDASLPLPSPTTLYVTLNNEFGISLFWITLVLLAFSSLVLPKNA